VPSNSKPNPVHDAPIPCFECGKVIPANASVCPSCGWTYESRAAE
jgi:rRNA maturation endonuclease Nob1